MPEKKVSVRLVAEGGGQVRAEFQGVGADGEAAFARIEKGQRSAAASAAVFVEQIAREEDSFRELRAQLDPAYAATRRYEAAVETANRAVRAGAASQAQAAQVIDLARVRMERAAVATAQVDASIVRVGRAANTGSLGLRNLGLQLNQVAQSTAVTGNFMSSLAIQLPDILASFGGLAGILAGVGVGFAAALLPSLFDTEDAAEAAEEQIKSLTTALSALEAAQKAAATPQVDLFKQYGAPFAGQAKELLEIQRQSAAAALQGELDRASENIATAAFGNFGGRASSELAQVAAELSNLTLRAEALDTMLANVGEGASEALGEKFRWQIEQIALRVQELAGDDFEKLSKALSLTDADAADLAAKFAALGEAQTAQEQAEAARQLSIAIREAAGGVTNMDEEVRAVYDSMLKVWQAALQVAGVDMATGVNEAANEAARLAANLEAAVAAANRIPGRTPGENWEIPGTVVDDLTWDERNRTDQLTRQVSERVARANAAGRRRGGGGGGAAREQRQFEQEAARIFDQTRTAAEKYAAELADLNELHKMGYLDAETFGRAIQQLDEEFGRGGLVKFRQELEGVVDSLAQAIVNGEDMGEVLGNVFRKLAADLISSGITGLFDLVFPSLGLGSGGKVKSFDGGGYTGDGPRSGGLDGRGGYLAMVHPRETVIDHAQGGRGAGGGLVTVRLVAGDGFDARVEGVARGVAVETVDAGISAYDAGLRNRVKSIDRDPRIR